MHCKHCSFVNGEDDHRCLRCGRRLSGVVIAAPPGYSGANALAQAVMMKGDTEEFLPVKAAALTVPDQPTLFTTLIQTPQVQTPRLSQNVIPFDRVLREAANRVAGKPPENANSTPPSTPATQTRVRKSAASPLTQDAQGTLDFIPGVPLKGRK